MRTLSPSKFNRNTFSVKIQHFKATREILTHAFSVLGFLAFGIYQFQMLYFREWGDESETIVGARMISSGQILYSEIFNHHGPYTFVLALALESLGNFSVVAHRVPIMILQWIFIISVYFSPNLKRRDVKLLCAMSVAGALSLGMIVTLLNTNTYQVTVGLLLGIALVQFVIPAIFTPSKLNLVSSTVGFFILASLSFFAVWYLPTALMLMAVSLRRVYSSAAVLGTALAAFFGVGFIVVFGSINGYLVDHFYVNAIVMSSYQRDETWLGPLTPRGIFDLMVLLVGPCSIMVSGFLLGKRMEFSTSHWRLVVLMLSLLPLLYRGISFQSIPFYVSAVALLVIGLMFIERSSLPQIQVLRGSIQPTVLFLSFCFIGAAVAILGVVEIRSYFNSRSIPAKTLFSELSDELTRPGDRVIAYPFENYEYIASNRLPASGDFFLLPWQEDLRLKAFPNSDISACDDISDYKPKIMLLSREAPWERYPLASYAGCIQKVADRDYVRFQDTDIYIRNDLQTRLRD